MNKDNLLQLLALDIEIAGCLASTKDGATDQIPE